MSTSSQCADESIKSIPKGTVQQKVQDVFNKSDVVETSKMVSSDSKYANIHHFSFNPQQTPDLVNTRPPSTRDYSAKPVSYGSQSNSTPTNADKQSKSSGSKTTPKTLSNKSVDEELTPVNEDDLEDVFNRNEDPNDFNAKFKGKPGYKQRTLFQFDDRSIERYKKDLKDRKIVLPDYENLRVTESSLKKSPIKPVVEESAQKQPETEQRVVPSPHEKFETKKSESKSNRNSQLARSEGTYESLKTPAKQSDKVSKKSTKTSESTDEKDKNKCTIVKLDEMENFHSLETNNELDNDSAYQVSLQTRSKYSELRYQRLFPISIPQ